MAYAAFFVLGYMFHACNADGAELTSMSAQAYSNNTARIESILDQDVRAGQEISDIVLEE